MRSYISGLDRTWLFASSEENIKEVAAHEPTMTPTGDWQATAHMHARIHSSDLFVLSTVPSSTESTAVIAVTGHWRWTCLFGYASLVRMWTQEKLVWGEVAHMNSTPFTFFNVLGNIGHCAVHVDVC